MWCFKKTTLRTQENNYESRIYTLEDYEKSYFYIKRVFRVLGLRLGSKDSRLVEILYNTRYTVVCILLLLPLAQNFYLIHKICSNGDFNFDDVLKIFKIIPCIGYLALAPMKTYKIVCQRSVFENLVQELRSMWPQGLVTEEEHTVISTALKKIAVFSKTHYFCNYGLVIVIAVPWYIDVVRRMFGKEVPRILPYDYWVPYDSSQPVAFELTLSLQVFQTLLCMSSLVAGDLIFCVFLSHITTQFDLLSIRIQRFFYVPIDEQLIASYPLGEYSVLTADNEQIISPSERDISHRKELFHIIFRHKALIRLAGDVEKLFTFSLLINFIYSSLNICFCGFCSLLVEKWNVFMYKIFLITALSQTWLLCWYGDKLLESSTRLSEALYNSGWYTASPEVKKAILIMMHRSQKSLHVTTYGFSIISLRSYTVIIKTSWSYFTLLLNFCNK